MRVSLFVETASQERPGIGGSIIRARRHCGNVSRTLSWEIAAADSWYVRPARVRDLPFADLAREVIGAVTRLLCGFSERQFFVSVRPEGSLQLVHECRRDVDLNGKVRGECFNQQCFRGLPDARYVIGAGACATTQLGRTASLGVQPRLNTLWNRRKEHPPRTQNYSYSTRGRVTSASSTADPAPLREQEYSRRRLAPPLSAPRQA
jgi:hypothetical protein